MKSIQIEKFGGPEVLVIKDVDIAKPGPKEVLIKNKSIGLNFIDVYHRTGPVSYTHLTLPTILRV